MFDSLAFIPNTHIKMLHLQILDGFSQMKINYSVPKSCKIFNKMFKLFLKIGHKILLWP